jgi:probable sporulation protein (polysaccharide deacetylase family)
MTTKKWSCLLIMCMISFNVVNLSIIHAEDEDKAANQLSLSHPQKTKDTELLLRIKEEAEKRKIPAIDAKVDQALTAVPGYNGLEIDIEKTYELAKMNQNISSIKWIYREVPPKVNLQDLGPHPIFQGNPQKRMASLMINVAWGDEFIPRILEILQKEQVHATFFFDGSWLKKHIATAKLIAAQGHELSNHAYSHKNMSQLNESQAKHEIMRTEAILTNELGVKNTLFAPPSGDYNMATVKIAYNLNLKTVLWTIDTVDWKNPSPDSIIQKISRRIEPGAMILMHPTNSSSKALESMIKEIKRKELVLNTVSELLSTQRTNFGTNL